MEIPLKLPSPIQVFDIPVFKERGIELLVKREDQIHPSISGNKWRKLKYNLKKARALGKSTLVTFGGAYSNHLYATAAAGQFFGFHTIGLVRGEANEILNPTLDFATSCGMEIRYLSRSVYRAKEKALVQESLNGPEYYHLPEGGTNALALPGCAEVATEIKTQLKHLPDYICLCCGTGGTMAGLIAGLGGASQVLGFSVLKGDFHQPLIQDLLAQYQKENIGFSIPQNWSIECNHHLGGYARFNQELIEFINRYQIEYQLPLDPVYTAKMFLGLEKMAQENYFKSGSTILAIHTGGLQGVAGFNQRFGNLILGNSH